MLQTVEAIVEPSGSVRLLEVKYCKSTALAAPS